MTADRLNALEAYTVQELVGELRRRQAELHEALALLVLTGSGRSADGTKNPRMSSAKAAYWAKWHEYKTSHPKATVKEWQKSKTTKSTKTTQLSRTRKSAIK